MKRLLALFLLLPLIASAAVEYDLRKGMDLTGTNRISAAALNQLVDNGTTATNKGMILKRVIRPSVTDNSRYTNFLWLDISAGFPGTLRQYICCGDADTNWVAGTIGVGSIVAANLAEASVIAGKVNAAAITTSNYFPLSVDSAALKDGSVVSNKLASSSVTSDKIVPGTITTANIGTNQISTALIADSAVTSNKVAAGAIGITHLATSAVNSNAVGAAQITNDKIPDGGLTLSTKASVETGTNGQVLQLSAGLVNWRTAAATYRSGDTAFTAADKTITGLTNVTHNLGGLPDVVKVYYIAKGNSAGHGYSVGDQIDAANVGRTVSYSVDVTTLFTSTTFSVIGLFGDGVTHYVVKKDASGYVNATDAQMAADFNIRIVLIRFSP
jgi:hypothetical protein